MNWQAIRIAAYSGLAVATFGAGWMVNGWRIEGQQAAALKAALKERDAAVAFANEAQRKADDAETGRLVAEMERAAMARQLEDEANADPDTSGGLPASRVLRLNKR